MHAPSLIRTHCPFCGRPATNNHHIVPRSQGGTDGPLISVCGLGNTCGCHGLLHQHKLHLRYDFDAEVWEFIFTYKSTKYDTALKMSGWQPVPEQYKRARLINEPKERITIYGTGKVPNRGTGTAHSNAVGTHDVLQRGRTGATLSHPKRRQQRRKNRVSVEASRRKSWSARFVLALRSLWLPRAIH